MKKRITKKHILLFVKLAGSSLVLFACILFFRGYRLSSVSAAESIPFAQPVQYTILLKEQISEDLDFYLLDLGDSYETAYSRRDGLLWRAELGRNSYQEKRETDKVQLMTKFFFADAETGWLISTSYDPSVKHFKVTYGETTIEQEALYGQPTVILLPADPTVPYSYMDVVFDAVALSGDDVPVYELCYPIRNEHSYTHVYTQEYGWYPVT